VCRRCTTLLLRISLEADHTHCHHHSTAALRGLIATSLQPVFTSQTIGGVLKTREPKPNIISQQCVVYLFKCGLCDMDYVGYINRHLHQRVAEHSSLNSSIGKHMHDTHGMSKPNLINNFLVLKKCRNKFDCLIHEMLIIQDLKPTLNLQTDSIRAKLFT